MTRLADDLRAIVAPHARECHDQPMCVPLGMLRALLIALDRYDTYPLVDRITEIPVVPQVRRAHQRKGWRRNA